MTKKQRGFSIEKSFAHTLVNVISTKLSTRKRSIKKKTIESNLLNVIEKDCDSNKTGRHKASSELITHF